MYIQLNSQIICYEKTGEGSPVILIHGNKGDHHCFDPLARTMSYDHTVIAMDTRGHGESATPKEYHYSDMADDVINLIEALDLEKPFLVGYSDGGIIALLVAIKRSDLIRGIACCGANVSPKGLDRSTLKDIKRTYKKTEDPLLKLMLEEPNIDDKMLSKIKVKSLIIAGQNDCIREKETKHIASKISDAELIIIPCEDHSSYVENTDKLYPHIKNYL